MPTSASSAPIRIGARPVAVGSRCSVIPAPILAQGPRSAGDHADDQADKASTSSTLSKMLSSRAVTVPVASLTNSAGS